MCIFLLCVERYCVLVGLIIFGLVLGMVRFVIYLVLVVMIGLGKMYVIILNRLYVVGGCHKHDEKRLRSSAFPGEEFLAVELADVPNVSVAKELALQSPRSH